MFVLYASNNGVLVIGKKRLKETLLFFLPAENGEKKERKEEDMFHFMPCGKIGYVHLSHPPSHIFENFCSQDSEDH